MYVIPSVCLFVSNFTYKLPIGSWKNFTGNVSVDSEELEVIRIWIWIKEFF